MIPTDGVDCQFEGPNECETQIKWALTSDRISQRFPTAVHSTIRDVPGLSSEATDSLASALRMDPPESKTSTQ